MWTIESAIKLCIELQIPASLHGLALGITGSCLTKGLSSKDLDIVVYPLQKGKEDIEGFRQYLINVRRWVSRRSPEELITYWKSKGLTDTKRVEVWMSIQGRIDLMYMS